MRFTNAWWIYKAFIKETNANVILFESYEDIDDEETYELYIDDYIIEDLNITREDVIDSVRSMADNVKVMNKPEGISFKCNDTDTYENIIDAIELLGVEPEVLGNMLDEKYLRY